MHEAVSECNFHFLAQLSRISSRHCACSAKGGGAGNKFRSGMAESSGIGGYAFSLCAQVDPTMLDRLDTLSSCVSVDVGRSSNLFAALTGDGVVSLVSLGDGCQGSASVRSSTWLRSQSSGETEPINISGWTWSSVHVVEPRHRAASHAAAARPVCAPTRVLVVCLADMGACTWDPSTGDVSFAEWKSLIEGAHIAGAAASGRAQDTLTGKVSCARIAGPEVVAIGTRAGTVGLLHVSSSLSLTAVSRLPSSSSSGGISSICSSVDTGSTRSSAEQPQELLHIGTEGGEVLTFKFHSAAGVLESKPWCSVSVGSGPVISLQCNSTQQSSNASRQTPYLLALLENGELAAWPHVGADSREVLRARVGCATTSKRSEPPRWAFLLNLSLGTCTRQHAVIVSGSAPPAMFVCTLYPPAAQGHSSSTATAIVPVVTGGYCQAAKKDSETVYWKVGQLSAFQAKLQRSSFSSVVSHPSEPGTLLCGSMVGAVLFKVLASSHRTAVLAASELDSGALLRKRYNSILAQSGRQLLPIELYHEQQTLCSAASAAAPGGGALFWLDGDLLLHAQFAGVASEIDLKPHLSPSLTASDLGLHLPSLHIEESTGLAGTVLGVLAKLKCDPQLSCPSAGLWQAHLSVHWPVLHHFVFVQVLLSCTEEPVISVECSGQAMVCAPASGARPGVLSVQAPTGPAPVRKTRTKGTSDDQRHSNALSPLTLTALESGTVVAAALEAPSSVDITELFPGPLLAATGKSRGGAHMLQFLRLESSRQAASASGEPASHQHLQEVGTPMPAPLSVVWVQTQSVGDQADASMALLDFGSQVVCATIPPASPSQAAEMVGRLPSLGRLSGAVLISRVVVLLTEHGLFAALLPGFVQPPVLGPGASQPEVKSQASASTAHEMAAVVPLQLDCAVSECKALFVADDRLVLHSPWWKVPKAIKMGELPGLQAAARLMRGDIAACRAWGTQCTPDAQQALSAAALNLLELDL